MVNSIWPVVVDDLGKVIILFCSVYISLTYFYPLGFCYLLIAKVVVHRFKVIVWYMFDFSFDITLSLIIENSNG